MNIGEMVCVFQANNVPEHYYTIGGLGGGECYGIEFINREWIVYYSERGRKSILHRSGAEATACLELIRYIDEMMQADFVYCLKTEGLSRQA